MAALNPLSLTPLLDAAGRPLAGAQIYIFDASTLTPRTVYSDPGLSIPLSQPILTPGSGRIPAIWSSGNPLKVRILEPAPGSGIIEEIDGLPGDLATSSGGSSGGGSGSTFETGDYLFAHRTGPRSGWVRADARTIGSDVSGATERANLDCHALFVTLWNADSGLTVSGGRGVSAEADWSANKQITLPDLRGRTPYGLDDMGNTSAGRLVGATFGTGNGTTLGAVGGTGVETLVLSQIPSHYHGGSTDGQGSHQHTGSTYGVGDHAHGAASDSQGDHTHNVSYDKIAVGSGAGGQVVSDISGSGRSNNVATLNAGSHAHNITVYGAGGHAHGFVTDAAGYHAHNVTTSSAGGGASHNNMPPFLLGTWYIRL